MNKTTIKSDIRTGGYLFRPQPSTDSYPALHTTKGESSLAIGVKVRASHIGQTPFVKIVARDVTEFWHSHGTYIGVKDTSSIWNPAL